MARTDTQTTPSPIGENVSRIDTREKVTGAAIYADDIQFGNSLLHARIKRSPHPHALIKKIDTAKASALPGVKAVVTGEDFPGYIGLYLKDRHIFCRDRVRYVGDPVVGVAAISEEIAERALDLIEVEYEVLEPVLDPEFGASPKAPLLHPNLEQYTVANFIFPQPETNISNHFKIRKGDVDGAWDKCAAKLGRNQLSDLSIVGVTALGRPDSSCPSGYRFRLALASVAPVPFVPARAETYLANNSITPESLREAARLSAEACMPIDDVRGSARYRKQMVRNLSARALTEVWEKLK